MANINVPEVNVRWKTSKGIFLDYDDANLSLGEGEGYPTKVFVMTVKPSNVSDWDRSVDILLGEECVVRWHPSTD